MPIASLTKAFTATAIGELVGEGKVDWDTTPVSKYLPEFELQDPTFTSQLTLQDLLSHRSGFPQVELGWFWNTESRRDLIKRLKYVKAQSKLRSYVLYNNVMFTVAGEAAANVEGVSYEDFVRKRILEPLGLNNTGFSAKEMSERLNYAMPYEAVSFKDARNGDFRQLPLDNMATAWAPAGDMYSNVLDLVQWGHVISHNGVQNGKQVLNKDSIIETLSGQAIYIKKRRTPEFGATAAYGMGWMLDTYKGNIIYHHTGRIDGFVSNLAIFPDSDLVVAHLCNVETATLPFYSAYYIADEILNLPTTQDWFDVALNETKNVFDNIAKVAKGEFPKQIKNRPSQRELGHAALVLGELITFVTDPNGSIGGFQIELHGRMETAQAAKNILLLVDTMLETGPQVNTQAFHPIYNNGSPIPPTQLDTAYITPFYDSISGMNVILWSDILTQFEGALCVRNGDNEIQFLKDSSLVNLDPLRISAIPDVMFNVVLPDPLDQVGLPHSVDLATNLQGLQQTPSDDKLDEDIHNHSNNNQSDQSNGNPGLLDGVTRLDSMIDNNGNTGAQFYDLGVIYQNGDGVQQDYSKAMEWYLKASDQGNSDAQRNIGLLYQSGYGTPVDSAKAFEWHLKASYNGNFKAQENLGMLFYCYFDASNDWSGTMNFYLEAANQGHTNAQVVLGFIYLKGYGVPKDYTISVEWLLKAGNQGNAWGQNILAFMYQHGNGVPRDVSKMWEWYRKSADQGYPMAIKDIGSQYCNGRHTYVDYSKALERFYEAVDHGSIWALGFIGYMYRDGLAVQRDYSKAMEWYLKGSEQGDVQSHVDIGILYQNGYGVPQDYSKAMMWYLKSANQGYPDAQTLLGDLYLNGLGAPRDYTIAKDLFLKAATNGEPRGEYFMGYINKNGCGIPLDYSKAFEWYLKGAEHGDAYAQYELGSSYKLGEGVKKDLSKAKDWYTKAANQGHPTA
ncbi:hypothetical protein BGZ76_002680, partial [Entomortierella beljakovae]